MRRPSWGLTLTVAFLALGTAVAAAVDAPATRRAEGSSVEVVGATAVCPDLRQSAGLSTRISVGSAPLPAGRSADGGAVTVSNVVGRRVPLPLPVQAPGQVVTGLGAGVDRNALDVRATGALAVGLEAEQITRGETTASRARGLAGVRCAPPTREAWFLGGATKERDVSTLVLVNVEDTPATVDVSVLTPEGPADPRPGQGVTVPPRGRVEIPVDTLAPDQRLVAVHVVSRRGRLGMALRHSRYGYPTSLGIDYVPQTLPPAKVVTVPGFPSGPGYRVLLLANPTQDDTTVRVRVTTTDGQFVPVGLDEVPVPAGQTTVASLISLTNRGPLSAEVESSTGPVLAAGMVIDTQGSPVQDFGYTAGSAPLSGDALLTDVVIDRPTESTLILTAPEGPARVVVRPIKVVGTAGAPPAPRTVAIPGGRTVTFRLSTFYPAGTSTRLAVEVQPVPGSGPVYAARYLRARGAHGPLSTLLDLQGPAQRVQRPPVVQDVEAGYR